MHACMRACRELFQIACGGMHASRRRSWGRLSGRQTVRTDDEADSDHPAPVALQLEHTSASATSMYHCQIHLTTLQCAGLSFPSVTSSRSLNLSEPVYSEGSAVRQLL